MFRRVEQLLGEDIKKLHKSRVIVFGIGGVGGYVVEMLVRAGIGTIAIVDFDKVDVSNKNRQIIALDSTIGRPKVEVMAERVYDINPSCNLIVHNDKLTVENIDEFNLKNYDYIIDCIDMVTSKIALIEFANKIGVKIISSMGVGNRLGVPEFEISDISKTYNDGLAKVLRKKLREKEINSHKVVFCKNNAITSGDTIGSISYYPAMSGCLLSAYVIDQLLKKE